MHQFVSIIGLLVFVGIAFALSSHKKQISYRVVVWGLLLQMILALLVLGIPAIGFHGPLQFLFKGANDIIISVLNSSLKGSEFLFGPFADDKRFGVIFAFQVLPTIIFMASLMGVFYYLGIMQKIVYFMAVIMQKTMRISGAESLSIAANVFVGQTEAPLMIKPYINKMTKSELFAVMVGGMATVAGGVLAAYVKLLVDRIPDIAGHLLTASVMSAPAALAISKLIMPETDKPQTLGDVPEEATPLSHQQNIIDAAAHGALEGLKLALNVAAMLIAFIALIALVDALLGWIGGLAGFADWGPEIFSFLKNSGDTPAKLSLSFLLGLFFSPIAWLMGIPWEESMQAGALLGEKVVINEFVAYLHLSQIMDQLSERTVVILSYALCGFANFSSIAIQIGGIGGIAPSRQKDLAQFGIRAVIGGSLAAFLTATIAGILI